LAGVLVPIADNAAIGLAPGARFDTARLLPFAAVRGVVGTGIGAAIARQSRRREMLGSQSVTEVEPSTV
jgi:hypothetical protein